MVLILSENSDISTNQVIEWIINIGYPFIRINREDKIELVDLNLSSFSLLINNEKVIKYEDITSVWFRRGEIKLNGEHLKIKNTDNQFTKYLIKHLKEELKSYEEYIYDLLLKKNI